MIRIIALGICAAVFFSCSTETIPTANTPSTIVHSGYASENERGLYKQISIDSLVNVSYKDFDVHNSYRYKHIKLLFGAFKSQLDELSEHDTEPDSGLRLLVLDQNDKLIFRSKGQYDSNILKPKFYRLDDQSPIIILAEIGNEYSWGNIIFSMDEKGVKEIGEIDLAGINTQLNEYADISKVTKIEKVGNNLIFRFDSDSVIVNPGGRNEKVVASKGYRYIYNGKDFKVVEE